MKIKLFVIGKTNFDFVKIGFKEYEKRLSRFVKFEYVVIKEGKSNNSNEVKTIEAKNIIDKITSNDYLILLDNNGKEYNSINFANLIENKMNTSSKDIVFLIGGAYGFDDSIYQIAKEKISLSQMTFSHQIIRLIFIEQLYRAFTIINNHPYHNE
jgi:23S rRNA (pseudouridine1915-N3)-methyltransferase